jgi:hypothetical protein
MQCEKQQRTGRLCLLAEMSLENRNIRVFEALLPLLGSNHRQIVLRTWALHRESRFQRQSIHVSDTKLFKDAFTKHNEREVFYNMTGDPVRLKQAHLQIMTGFEAESKTLPTKRAATMIRKTLIEGTKLGVMFCMAPRMPAYRMAYYELWKYGERNLMSTDTQNPLASSM